MSSIFLYCIFTFLLPLQARLAKQKVYIHIFVSDSTLNKTEILKFTTGRVIDLVSNDVQRLEDHTVLWSISALLDFFLLVPIIVVLLVYFIGWQALMGVTCLFLLVPYFIGLSYVFAVLRLKTAASSDKRISLLNQVISGIRAIKTQALEDKFREKIKSVRR